MFIYLTLKISIIIIINFHILVITHYTVTPISESSIIFFNPHKLIFTTKYSENSDSSIYKIRKKNELFTSKEERKGSFNISPCCQGS